MNVGEIDRLVRDAVARAGHSSAVVPELGAVVCFHAVMGNERMTPERVNALIEELMPQIAQALAEEASVAARTLPMSETTH